MSAAAEGRSIEDAARQAAIRRPGAWPAGARGRPRGRRAHARRPGGNRAAEAAAGRRARAGWRASIPGTARSSGRFSTSDGSSYGRGWPITGSRTWRTRRNEDLANPRNLMRHEVLPALQGWFGAVGAAALARAAEIARADEELLARADATARPAAVRRDGERVLRGRRRGWRSRRWPSGAAFCSRRCGGPGSGSPGSPKSRRLGRMLEGEAAPASTCRDSVRADRNGTAVVLSGRDAEARAADRAVPLCAAGSGPRLGCGSGRNRRGRRPAAGGPLPSGTPDAPGCRGAGARADRRAVRPQLASGGRAAAGRARRHEEAAGSVRRPQGAPRRAAPACRSSWTVTTASSGCRGTHWTRVYRASAGGSGVVVLKLTRQWGGPE